jgi:uncharacterized protein
MMQRYLSPDGTPYGNEEIFRHGSRANAEHCGAVEWMIASHSLARITGEVKYADAVERAMYNGYAAPKSPDGMTLGYMHSPNQLVASEWSQPHDNDGDVDWWASRQHYSTAHEPLCCNSNGPRGLPFFVESMVWQSRDGLAIGYYGPCRVRTKLNGAGDVSVVMTTEYPFEDDVTVKVRSEKRTRFPIDFRIPAWCVQASAESQRPARSDRGETRNVLAARAALGRRANCQTALHKSGRSVAQEEARVSHPCAVCGCQSRRLAV